MTHLRSLPGFVLAAALLSTGASVGAPAPAIPSTPPDIAARMSTLFAKASPAVRAWVGAEARKLRPLPPPDASSLAADARQGFPSAQPPLTPGQADTLAAMAVYQVVNDLDSEARLPLGPEAGDALARFSERKSALLKTLSTLLRRVAEADAAIVASLK